MLPTLVHPNFFLQIIAEPVERLKVRVFSAGADQRVFTDLNHSLFAREFQRVSVRYHRVRCDDHAIWEGILNGDRGGNLLIQVVSHNLGVLRPFAAYPCT